MLTQLGSPWVAQWVWVPTVPWVWSLWVGVDPVWCSMGCPASVGTYCSVGLISVGGCWPSWVLHGLPSGCGYLPFCGSDLCRWVLTQLGSPWVTQRVWVPTILWVWSLWVGVDPVGFSVGRPAGVGDAAMRHERHVVLHIRLRCKIETRKNVTSSTTSTKCAECYFAGGSAMWLVP